MTALTPPSYLQILRFISVILIDMRLYKSVEKEGMVLRNSIHKNSNYDSSCSDETNDMNDNDESEIDSDEDSEAGEKWNTLQNLLNFGNFKAHQSSLSAIGQHFLNSEFTLLADFMLANRNANELCIIKAM
ncbi:unnamed protein product [Brugia pahangi]|uniref:Rav1p_C domain-containing protein n=1 Tax=Brugia pahangi TaxID=6280 RepID=A0A0N4TXB6_BRUPA|nr:unnamed protein product [Brugia pahangi]